MKKIIWKAYYNYEKEEKWLNQMSSEGMALMDYSWCRYVFLEEPKGKYIYRIELLKHLPSHPQSKEYIKFLGEMGVECVATYLFWIYLRKEAADGPFDIYSDIDSKIKLYKRIKNFYLTLMWIELVVGIINLIVGLSEFSSNVNYGTVEMTNVSMGVILILIGVMFFSLSLPLIKKIKSLKKQKILME